MFGVLIAEDDPMLGDLVEDALTANGYWVCGVAHTVVNAVALGRLHYPDLAVIDAVDHCWVLLLAVSSLRPVAAFAAPGFCLTANYLARHCVVRLSGEFSRRGRDVTLSVYPLLKLKGVLRPDSLGSHLGAIQ
jgi:hypothetical protein